MFVFPFLSGPCGHVVSGELNIIRNREIRDLMKMGAKYGEPVTQPWSCMRSSIVDCVSNFVNKMCTKFKLSVNSLNALFNRVVGVHLGYTLSIRPRHSKWSLHGRSVYEYHFNKTFNLG